jgi:hypothetical protein
LRTDDLRRVVFADPKDVAATMIFLAGRDRVAEAIRGGYNSSS